MSEIFFLYPELMATVLFRPRLEAINRWQAVIEFSTDGTILDANRNFLAAMGYELDEIVGHHHRMFVSPD